MTSVSHSRNHSEFEKLLSDSSRENQLIWSLVNSLYLPTMKKTGRKTLDQEEKSRKCCLISCFPVRYVFNLISCLGILCLYTMRINLNVAMVAMVNNTAVGKQDNESQECSTSFDVNSTTTSQPDGEFIWDEYIQGIILGAFYWGYVVSQLPGGRLGELYSPKWIFGLGVLSTSVLTLFTPLAARSGSIYLVVIRALEGLGEGATFPTMNSMIARWSPPEERSRTSTVIFAGALLGTVFGMPLSGYLTHNGFADGWPSVFYVFGIMGIAWFILWSFLVYDDPESHPWISSEEATYISESIKKLDTVCKKPKKFPIKQVATSLPMWAIIVSHFCNNWGFCTLLTELPTYMSNILHYDMKTNSLLSALPYLTSWIFSVICSSLCDFLIKRKYLSTTAARRTFNGIGQIIPGIFILLVTFSGCNKVLTYAFLVCGMTAAGAIYSGYNANHVDIASNYSGTLLGITNTIGNIPGIAGPYVVGVFTRGESTQKQWNKVFYITCATYLFSGVFFGLFAQGVEQPWNKLKEDEDDYHEQNEFKSVEKTKL